MSKDRKFNLSANHKATGKMTAGSLHPKSQWHKPDSGMTYFPRNKEDFIPIDELAKKYIFDHYYPELPMFGSDDKVVTMGSCFADRLRTWLRKNGKNADYITVPEGLNNSFAVRQWIEWICTGDRSSDAYWYDNDKSAGAFKWEPEQEQKELLDYFKTTKGFVVTYGLAEVWRDKKTKGVFWRGVPNKVFSPELHESVTSTVEENVNNMKRIADLIHQTCGEDKHIIYTLSPVPLAATFQNRPTMVSDCVSKSILRVALDEYFRKHNPKNVYYWPSFEMVRWVGPHTEIATLFEDNTTRHVNNSIVSIIIDNFVKAFFKN